jgi:hypothetical protein
MLKFTMGFGFLVGNANCTRLQGVLFGVFINYYDVRSNLGILTLGLITIGICVHWNVGKVFAH